MTPDVEKITGAYLRSESAIIALVDDRVGGKHPRSTDTPWVKIVQIGDTVIQNNPVYFTAVKLQIDCYGGEDEYTAHGEASLLARTVRQSLSVMADDTHTGAVVTDVKFGALSRIPDTDFEPARERFILTADVYSHRT